MHPHTFDWNNLKAVEAPGASANPVLKLTFHNGDIYWLKAAPGGERVIFSDHVMNRMGFDSVKSSLIAVHEFQQFKKIGGRLAIGRAVDVVQEIEKQLQTGISLIMSADVGGHGTYDSILEGNLNQEKKGADYYREAVKKHLKVMSSLQAQQDLSRMIAVDAILGNFDRASIYSNGASGHFHTGNFIYNAVSNGFLPIDNDMVSPSLLHIREDEHSKKKPTKADLYRAAIYGGVLLGGFEPPEYDDDGNVVSEKKQVFANANQANMYLLLNESLVVRVLKIIQNPWGGSWDPEKMLSIVDKAKFSQIAQNMAEMVRQAVRDLVDEMKTGTAKSGEEGLLKTLKALQSVEGMDYSVLKVRSKFAELMTLADQPPSQDEAEKYALSYGKYRDWKEDLQVILSLPGAVYKFPDAHLHGMKNKVLGQFNKVIGGQNLNNINTVVESAKKMAKEFSNPLPIVDLSEKYKKLRASYIAHISSGDDSDRNILKAKIILIPVLVRCELLQMRDCFQQLHQESIAVSSQGGSGIDQMVARVYARAFYKREATMHKILNFYRLLLEQIKKTIQAVGSISAEDMKLIGIGGHHEELLSVYRDCNRIFNCMKISTLI